jgi:hypothetical protein
MASIAQQLEVLSSSTPAQLRAEWRRVFRKDAPPHSPDLMIRAITWRLQSRIHGDLSWSIRQRLVRLADQLDQHDGTGQIAASPLAPGTRLVREWNERTIEVIVLDAGYLFDDRHFTSLSQIARHVTGTQWSGPRFFGLKKARKLRGDRGHSTR